MATDLTAKLYDIIDKRDGEREILNWHASSIAKCPRALYYERKKIKGLPLNKIKPGKKLRFRGGHSIEATIREDLEVLYPNLLSNVRFTNQELDLTGEFDAYDPDSKTLISVKSVHDFAFISIEGKMVLKHKIGTKINRAGREVNDYGQKKDPYIHHEWQEHSYKLLFSSDKTLQTIEDGVAVEIDPADWQVENIDYIYITLGGLMDTFRTSVQPAITKRVQDKLKYLNECYKSSTLPVCLCQPGQEMYDVTDQYCPYKTETGCCSPSLMETVA